VQGMKTGSVDPDLSLHRLIRPIDCDGKMSMRMIGKTPIDAFGKVRRKIGSRLVREKVYSSNNDRHQDSAYQHQCYGSLSATLPLDFLQDSFLSLLL